jgi:hypothetical protein
MSSIVRVDYLTPEEEIALLTNEQIIGDEFRSHIDVGLALADVRQRRLYRMDYGTFTEYYRNKWHFQTGKVHYLIGTAAARRERAERRQQLTQTIDQLLELILRRKPHEELVKKASLFDQHVRFFFPKNSKKKR